MENFCHTHHANHSNKTCLELINSFSAMLLPPKLPKKDKKEEEEEDNDGDEEEEAKEEEEEPPSHLNLIWDETEVDNEDDDVMGEACVGNDYNLRSKGAPTSSNSPSTLKKATKKSSTATTSTPKETYTRKSPKKNKTNENDSTGNKSTTNMDITRKILGDLNLHYDVVENLKKMKENITVFELCKITQLREKLHESFHHIQGSRDVMVGNTKETPKGENVKANKMTKTSTVANTSADYKAKTIDEKGKGDPRVHGALIEKKYRSQTPPFLLTFEIFNPIIHNYLVDSASLSNIMPYLACKKLNVET